ncbi:MAG: deoxynucleoside kinase [Candidatus Pacebacteria bacterium]|nr:deoxynucleoside kinase [Candidatus Paceibacterota bacterium]
MKKAGKGRLIVIDGTDGSGKTTQSELLKARLTKDGFKVKMVDFPEYYDNFFGEFLGHCLSEQYYHWVNIHPKIASVVYAADRFESKQKIENWLKAGYVVLANRYVSANQIHQGGKIRDTKKRAEFMKWLEKMEYGVFNIPRPDLVLYLRVPMPIIKRLIKTRNMQHARAYLGKKKDVHETDFKFLENSEKSALWLAGREKNWRKVECAKGSEILPREVIHEEIYKSVLKVLKK